MKKHLTKKRVILLAIAGVAAALAAGAFAYFTATGSGTGTATVGSASNINLSSDPVTGLFPGGADVPVTVHISNPGGGAQFVNTVSGSVGDNGGCLGSWFQVDLVTYAATIAAGGSDTASTNVRMLDSGTNQNVCQGKSMTVNWSSN
jgi:ABC-type glycerol-3-phosphate transport system substrate-binding protein